MGKASKAAGGGSKKKQQQQQQQSEAKIEVVVVEAAAAASAKKRGRGRSTPTAATSPATTTDTTKMFSKKKKTTATTASIAATDKASTELNSISSTEIAIMEMFKEIAEDPTDPNSQADLDGISILGEKLEIDAAEDIRILVLLWKLGVGKSPTTTPDVPTSSNRGSYSSSSYSRSNSYPSTTPTTSSSSNGGVSKNFIPGTIQCNEWKYGCSKLNIDSWDKLLLVKPSLDIGFLDNNEFREFYKFCFRFNLNGTHKSLENDTAIGLLQMIYTTTTNDGDTIGGSARSNGRIDIQRYETIISFLQDPDKVKVYSMITLDQWMGLYDFCQEIPTNDMLVQNSKIYDESTSAWPVLIDDYVDYIQSSSSSSQSSTLQK